MMILLLISTVLVAGAAVTARPEMASARTAVSASFGVSIPDIAALEPPVSDPELRTRIRALRSRMQAGLDEKARPSPILLPTSEKFWLHVGH